MGEGEGKIDALALGVFSVGVGEGAGGDWTNSLVRRNGVTVSQTCFELVYLYPCFGGCDFDFANFCNSFLDLDLFCGENCFLGK